MVLEAVKSKIKTQEDPVSGEGLIPVFQMIVFSLYLHMEERERATSPSFLIRALIPLWELDSHNLITSQTPISQYHHFKASIYEFGRHTDIQFIAGSNIST